MVISNMLNIIQGSRLTYLLRVKGSSSLAIKGHSIFYALD